ncbi:MAG: hypothetical protein ACXWDL_00700 [Nocardioides sp.]
MRPRLPGRADRPLRHGYVWIDDVPALGEDVRCLAGPAPRRRIVIQGTPVATVSQSQPIAD